MVLTVSSDDEDVYACLEAGALGYLVKDQGLHMVASAIRDLVRGGSPMSPLIARKVLLQYGKGRADKTKSASDKNIEFTKRELAVLALIAQGLTYEETAERLCISVLTVQNYIKRLYRKLSVNSRGQAVFEAHRRGLINQNV
jgi:DNA-binding NarL/FixJ family response regulator